MLRIKVPNFSTPSSGDGEASSSNLVRPAIRGLKRARDRQWKPQEGDQWKLCSESAEYFIKGYCKIYDAVAKEWISFDLWLEQVETLNVIHLNQLVIILKARQLGLTWLVLAYFLWMMIFHPFTTLLVFSLRDTEAKYLIGDERWKGMYARLPDFLKVDKDRNALYFVKDDEHVRTLSNGSTVKAFPTSAGDSYSASAALVDEADLVPDLNKLMGRVKPTIDAGGKMILLSRVDKRLPNSEFKRIYRAAKQRLTKWVSVFLAWHTRPDRTQQWYEEQKADILHRTGSLDDLHEQYPATDTEALAPRTLDKRIPPDWIEQCYEPLEALALEGIKGAPPIPGLQIFRLPAAGRKYVQGIDPAEGNPTSDDSSLKVLDFLTGEEVASLTGKFQPSTMAAHADVIGHYYNDADVMVERNNHGHAVILWLQDNSTLTVLDGLDEKPGWLDNSRGKSLLYDNCADAFKSKDTKLHDFATFTQLSSIEGSTLRAPGGEMDDLADAYALALLARGYSTGVDDLVGPGMITGKSKWDR